MINGFGFWAELLDMVWLLFLTGLLVYFWRDRKALMDTRNWIKTKGKVILCQWTEDHHRLWPEIEYSYQVNDREYIGHYLFLDTSHNNPNSAYARHIAYKAAISYEQNQELDVYYNPMKPEQSALDIKIPPKLNLIIGFLSGLIFLHVSIIIFRILT